MADNKDKKVLKVPDLRFPEFTGEWQCKAIGKVAPLQRGFDLPTQNLVEGIYPVIYSNGILQHDKYKCEAPGLITGRSGTIGKFTYIDSGFYWPHNTSLWVTDFCGNCPKFIYYLYQTVHIEQFSTGSGVPTLNRNDVHRYKTFVPTAIVEQEKIAKFLSILDERIATQNKIIERYKSLIRGINQYAFTNTGINYKLGEICEIRSGYSGNQLTLKNGLKVSRIETISEHKVNMERVGYVAPFESSENYRLQIGDILFSNINSVEYIGNTAFIDKDYNLYHGMNLLRLIPKKELVIPFYLYLVLNTNRLLNHFKTVCNKAVSQASINQTELGKTIVLIPNLMNQNRICELFQTLYTKLEAERYFISLLQGQKQHLLRQMFI